MDPTTTQTRRPRRPARDVDRLLDLGPAVCQVGRPVNHSVYTSAEFRRGLQNTFFGHVPKAGGIVLIQHAICAGPELKAIRETASDSDHSIRRPGTQMFCRGL
ncbi:MAG: hypothetical protein NZ742_07675 [Acidobacteria bacterium]|nr:hypothetical protein [Acidobacteriota bacterium]MDW7984712.1 hypothetical protein [Acidobacteriota bacterium]